MHSPPPGSCWARAIANSVFPPAVGPTITTMGFPALNSLYPSRMPVAADLRRSLGWGLVFTILAGGAPADQGPATVQDAASPAASTLPEPSVNRRTGVRWYRNVAYSKGDAGEKDRRRLDLYLPREGSEMDGRPLLVWIHGGGWIMGNKDDAFGAYGRFCRKLAEHGVAVANVGYRLSPKVTHPAHIEDIASAVAWLAEHSGELGFSPDAIFVSGHSAGAHLAALLAVDDRWLDAYGLADAVIGVIPSSGIFDLRPIFEHRWGDWLPFNRETAADASPVLHLDENDPPMLLIEEEYGTYMRRQTSIMSKALSEHGIEHEVIEIPVSNHITMIADLVRDDGVHLRSTVAFITRVLRGQTTRPDAEGDGG